MSFLETGNDQIRFDVALGVLVPDKKILAPVRSLGWSRKQEAEWLQKRGVEVSLEVQDYSIKSRFPAERCPF
jgi:argininosuccinate synthase